MPWKCNTCGESHEDQFDSCWKCGVEREGNAVIRDFNIGVDIDYETVGANMLMVTASGTAVVLEPLAVEPIMDANLPSATQPPSNATD